MKGIFKYPVFKPGNAPHVSKRRCRYFYDPEDMLVLKIIVYRENGELTPYRYSDYVSIDGIKMRERIAYGDDKNKDTHGVVFQLNVDYDRKSFRVHPSPQQSTPGNEKHQVPR